MFKYQRHLEWRGLYKSTPVLAYSEGNLYMPFANNIFYLHTVGFKANIAYGAVLKMLAK